MSRSGQDARREPGPRVSEATLGRVVAALRELTTTHESWNDIARSVGCSAPMVSLILNGRCSVRVALAKRILEAAGYPVDVGLKVGALERWRAERRARHEKRLAAAAKRREAKRSQRKAREAQRGSFAFEPSRSASIDAVAALVAALLARHTLDPIAELDPKRPGCFAHRAEREVLALLYERYGSWNAVAMATRGRAVGATIQRNIERHEHPHEPMAPDLTRDVQRLLAADPHAWAALLDALESEDRAAE